MATKEPGKEPSEAQQAAPTQSHAPTQVAELQGTTPSRQERIDRAKARARICAYAILAILLTTFIAAMVYGAIKAKERFMPPPPPWYMRPEFLMALGALAMGGVAVHLWRKRRKK